MEQILEKKDQLNMQMMRVLENPSLEEYNALLSAGSKYFTEFEEYMFRNSEDGRNLTKTQAEDILNSIKNVFDFVLVYNIAMQKLSKKLNTVLFCFSPNFFTTSESIYFKYRKREAMEYRNKFAEQVYR